MLLTDRIPENLACPLDGEKLVFCGWPGKTSQVRCVHGHAFDVARQGYINLLGVQDKRSKDPGDTREMIAARGRILAAGLYEPLAEKLVVTVKALLPRPDGDLPEKPLSMLDAGCGEGYYLEYCLTALGGIVPVEGIGLDISKWAVMAAARRKNSDITWLVGSNRNPPVLSGSVDIIVCCFGFPDFPAFRRVLKPGGFVVMLDPGHNHLLELRRVIYPELKPYRDNDLSRALDQGFTLVRKDGLVCPAVKADAAQIRDILLMSPHMYKATAEGRAAALALAGLEVTLDVNLSILQVD